MSFYFIQAVALGFAAGMSPGPTQLYLMSRAVKTGWQRTLPGALAPLITDAPIIALTILILTRLPETFLFGLQIVGNLFILYLAFNAFQAFRNFEVYQPEPDQADAQKTLAEAALTNLLNPNPYIFWGTVGSQILLQAWQERPAAGIAFLAGFYLLLIGSMVFIVLLFGLMRGSNPAILRALIGLSALALFVLGVVRLVTGLVPYLT